MSRTVDILQKIKTGATYSPTALSRAENILKSIANGAGNLIDVKTATITGGALQRFNVSLDSVKGKTISASAFVENNSTEGNGVRIRVDITNNGTVTYAMGNDIVTGASGISKAENITVPATASKVEFCVQSYSGNVGTATFTRFMLNYGATAQPYEEYINDGKSRYENLLLCLKEGDTTSITPQTRLEKLLVAIANETLDEYLAGKNLFDEDAWGIHGKIENKNCLMFNGFYAATTGNKIGNPLLIAENLPVGTYTVKGKFKKTEHYNALAGLNESNVRTAFGTFKDNFTADTITFTTTEKIKYLYVDTGAAAANGYCEIETLMFGKNLGEQYLPYCFLSENEKEFYNAFGVK